MTSLKLRLKKKKKTLQEIEKTYDESLTIYLVYFSYELSSIIA